MLPFGWCFQPPSGRPRKPRNSSVEIGHRPLGCRAWRAALPAVPADFPQCFFTCFATGKNSGAIRGTWTSRILPFFWNNDWKQWIIFIYIYIKIIECIIMSTSKLWATEKTSPTYRFFSAFSPGFGEILHTEMPKRRWQRMFLSCVWRWGVHPSGSKCLFFDYHIFLGIIQRIVCPISLEKVCLRNESDDNPIGYRIFSDKPIGTWWYTSGFLAYYILDTPIWSFPNLSIGIIVDGC